MFCAGCCAADFFCESAATGTDGCCAGLSSSSAGAEEPAELLAFLNENGNAAALPDTLGVTARYDADMRPDPAGELRVDVCCTVEENSLVQGHIQVFRQGAEAPVYELETAALWKEVSP